MLPISSEPIYCDLPHQHIKYNIYPILPAHCVDGYLQELFLLPPHIFDIFVIIQNVCRDAIDPVLYNKILSPLTSHTKFILQNIGFISTTKI